MQEALQILQNTSATIATISFGGNTLDRYAQTFVLFFITYAILKFIQNIGLKRLKKITEKTKTQIDDNIVEIIDGIPRYFLFYIAFYINVQLYLSLPDGISQALYGLFIILSIGQVIRLAGKIIHIAFTKTSLKKDETTLNAVTMVFKIILWTIGILLILSNLGFNISTLAASLGIGGIAIALAAQNILGDLFASFTIFFDKPFKIGDFIVIGNDKGIIQKIGLKSTRLTTLQGEELVVSNKELTSIRIQNFKKMKRRRIVFPIGLVYGTSDAKLKKAKAIIQKIIEKEEHAEFNRCHFTSFGDFSLNFEIMYYVETNDYGVYLDTQESINLAINKAFEKEGIEMAFPTQTLHLVKQSPSL